MKKILKEITATILQLDENYKPIDTRSSMQKSPMQKKPNENCKGTSMKLLKSVHKAARGRRRSTYKETKKK